MIEPNIAPIACTLTGDDYKTRLAWIRELARDALKEHVRDGHALHLVYSADAKDRVREMIAKERVCCAFLKFYLREDAHEVRLTIGAPEDARDVADALFDEFMGGAMREEAVCGCR
jgi:hypothetical protein